MELKTPDLQPTWWPIRRLRLASMLFLITIIIGVFGVRTLNRQTRNNSRNKFKKLVIKPLLTDLGRMSKLHGRNPLREEINWFKLRESSNFRSREIRQKLKPFLQLASKRCQPVDPIAVEQKIPLHPFRIQKFKNFKLQNKNGFIIRVGYQRHSWRVKILPSSYHMSYNKAWANNISIYQIIKL